MSAYIKPYRKLTDPSKGGLGSKVPFGKLLYKTELSHYYVDATSPTMPEIPATPAAPTIDEATRTRQDTDRLRRRRGVLANIFAGGTAAAPSVGKATLGG